MTHLIDTVLGGEPYRIVDLPTFAGKALERLPWTLRILLENTLRRSRDDLSAAQAILRWLDSGASNAEIPFYPTRLLTHDTTCVPALVDIAAMRSALAEAGQDPTQLNPMLPIDVSVDHSIAVDHFGTRDALQRNMQREIERNAERYRLMKWATQVLRGVTVHPPGSGIMHTINLERLATVVTQLSREGREWACPDTLIGTDSHETSDGDAVYLRDLWPSGEEIDATLAAAVDPEDVPIAYLRAQDSAAWRRLDAPQTALFPWDESSTYIRRPPFASHDTASRLGTYRARPLLVLGDDITTDHISPAGQIPALGDAAEYLVARGANPQDLNVFSSRRGNWETMLRGLYTNRSVRNLLDDSIPAGMTLHAGSGELLPLWRAAEHYRAENVPVVIVAGERYGAGSSRDWAAKGLWLLGVRAVLALSFERIHRANLIGMGILPLRLPPAFSPAALKLSVHDWIEVVADALRLSPRACVKIAVHRENGGSTSIETLAEIETSLELELLNAGGVLPFILRSRL